jgi:2-polyprenyl-3-methyl-5-hydroxy-6-metoxy-1,4-benzoquinol methylase
MAANSANGHTETDSIDPARAVSQRDALVERLMLSTLGMMEIASVYIGDRLGFYQALAPAHSLTSKDLARRTSCSERYTREWLEQQAIIGLVELDDPERSPTERGYSLPMGHAEVLCDRDSLSYLTPLARQLIGAVTPMPALLDAYHTGRGVPYDDYGTDMRDGIAEANRVLFLKQLGQEWIPAMPDVHARLQAEPPARVADIACGTGWSSIALARAYPSVLVHGFDLDESSISVARSNAQREGLCERIQFAVRDAADPQVNGRFDLVVAFECVHDMAHPVEALRAMGGLLAPNGALLIADEKVAERFQAPGDHLERLFYGFSILHCLPVGTTEQPSAETGTVLRPEILRRYAAAAGFRSLEILPIDHDLWRFYRLYR